MLEIEREKQQLDDFLNQGFAKVPSKIGVGVGADYPPGSYSPARALSLVQSCSRVSFQIPVHWMHNSPIFNVLRRTILNLFLIIILSCMYKV